MIKTSYLIRVAAVVATLDYLDSSAPESGGHGHLFRQLCDLVDLAERPAPANITDKLAQDSYLAIAKLNASVAPQSWRDKIASKTEGAAQKQQSATADKQPTVPDPKEEYWTKAVAAIKDNDKRRQVLQKAGLDEVTEEQLASYRRKLYPIAEQAFHALQKVRQLTGSPDENKASDALKALKAAAYGRDDFTRRKATDGDYEGLRGKQKTRTLLCGDKSNDATATTIAQFLLCVCGIDSTDNNKLCESGQLETPLQQDRDQGQILKDLLNRCPQAEERTAPTATEVQTKTAALISGFQQKGTNTYYGFYTDTGCTGSKAKGICVMYKAGTRKELEALERQPWISKLKTPTKLLHEHEQALTTIRAVEHAIAAAAKTAYALKSAAITDERHSADSEQNQQTDKNKEKQPTNTNCSDTEKKTAKECKSLGCEHDEKENKCKPKAGTENTAAAAAGGAEDHNCGQYTDPDTCAKAPGKKKEGKNAVCGWIEGKCQDSSILLNKKFALSIVSAAFVALLF